MTPHFSAPLARNFCPRSVKNSSLLRSPGPGTQCLTDCGEIEDNKKPSSSVRIDPLNRFLVKHSDKLAQALTPIINAVCSGAGRPKIWKEEEGTIIPKKASPTSLDECRNISCTSIFSKLCESYLLDRLTAEITLDPGQFGGLKGVETEHLLVEMITDQMECLDDNWAASVHMSIDLEKAFNRMDHTQCLR